MSLVGPIRTSLFTNYDNQMKKNQQKELTQQDN